MTRAAFALPGDIHTLTGGYIYDRHLVEGLRALGWTVDVLSLGTSFPDASTSDQWDAGTQLAALPQECPVIIDGLAYGAMDPDVLTAVKAPIIALVHHPLAFENDVSANTKARLIERERTNLNRAVHVIVPSPHTAQMLRDHYAVPAVKITIARPGTVRPTSFPAPCNPPLILSVGIQVPRKGHDILLHAFALIKDLAWQGVIVGGIHDQAHGTVLAELVRALELDTRVTMPGRVTQDVLSQYYSQASVFALATRYEGYGIVFDEATVHGLPIVSCRVGAVPGTVSPNASLLVPPDDPASFAAALRRILTENDVRMQMAGAALEAARDLATWRSTATTVQEVLARLRT